MISHLTSVLTGIEQPDGQSIENARGFTDNDSNGALEVEMGEDYSGEEIVYVSDMYYAVSLVANTTYTIDYNGTPDERSMPSVQFENSGGTSQGTAMSGDYDPETWEYIVTPGSFTPSSSGIYYLHVAYSGEWATLPLLVSPRPQEHSCATRHIWEPNDWEMVKNAGFAKSNVTGISSPVVIVPFLSNATPSVNTKNATVTVTGTITYDGTGATTNGGNRDHYIDIAATSVFAGSYTVAGCFYMDSTANDERCIFGLRGMTPVVEGNEADTLVLFVNSTAGRVPVYAWNGYVVMRPTLKTGIWHTVFFAIDRDEKEIRIMVDGNAHITYKFTPSVVEAGMFKSDGGAIRLFATGNRESFVGKIKNIQIIDSALDFGQMQYLAKTLLS